VRFKGGTVGLAMLALLVGAPAAMASTASLRSGTTVVYAGDAAADTVRLSRQVYNNTQYYIYTDSGGITSGAGCVQVPNTSTMSACAVTTGLKRYEISTGDGDDRVTISADTAGGTTDLGAGADRFTGLGSGSAADAVTGGDGTDRLDGVAGNDLLAGGDGTDTLNGGDGNDAVDGGTDADAVSGGPGDDLVGGGDGADRVAGDDGNDILGGGPGDDQVAGQAGNDVVDGGPGDDTVEFGSTGMPAGGGAGGDELYGGEGVDLLSYNDHTTAIRVTIDEQPGDGSAGEGDNVHGDIETVIGTTLADALTGDASAQDLYGHGGNDTIDGGGNDLVNGGTGEDVVRGGAGDDAVEGSAGGDLLDGGPGRDLFAGDNECTVAPCTGGSDEIRARDGEVDTVNCGVGADVATVDTIDIVALDSQQGCESIDRADLPVAAAGPSAPAAGAAALLPKMSIRGARGVQTLMVRGILVQVTCPGACRIRGRLIFRKTVVAETRRTRIAPSVTRLRFKSNRAGRRLLRRRTKVLLTLVIDVTDSAGTKTTLARPITLKSAKAAKQKTS
jgi:Ca2+-binding RTX toxin-like protein